MTDGAQSGDSTRAVDDLFAREELTRALIDGAGDGIFMVDPEGRFLFVNDFIAESSGYPKEAFVGRHFLELIRPEDRERTQRNFERALAGEKVPAYELAYHTAAGEPMWVEINSARVSIDGEVRGVLAISRNLQRRKRFEEELRRSEEKYRTLVEGLPHMVSIIQGSRIVFANEAARRTFGLGPPSEHYDLEKFVAPGGRERARAFMRQRAAGEEAPRVYQTVVIDAEGRELPVEIHARPTEFEGRPAVQYVVMDLSERRKLEEQLQHAQKMEAIGLLAGGIAHDFNNLLTAILATADMMRERHPPGDPDHQAADLVYRAALQSAGLTQQLLGFAHKSNPERKRVDVDELVDEVCEILDRTLGKKVEITKQRGVRPFHALGDAVQLQQVLMNLVVNARDAMPSGGQLRIRTEPVHLDDPALLDAFGIPAGPYLKIVVEDSGVGIPASIRERIFEPFFTTKSEGKGSGMGLAVVYGILRAHGAAISIQSREGSGTAVSVFLPPAEPVEPEAPTPSTSPRGRGVVLLVDDERLVRETAARLLESLGYEVIACASGPEAIERFREEHERIDVALIDVRMPQMDGWTCFEELKRIDPGLRVIMTSGHGRTGDEPPDAEELDFLAKPYDLASLAAAIARHAPSSGSDGSRP